MFITQIIGFVVFVISLCLAILAIMSCLFKNIGTTYFGISTLFIYSIIPLFPFFVEQSIFHVSPDVWGMAYIFIAMNAFFAIIPYYNLIGTLFFGKKYIYRLNEFLIPKRYSYKNVIRYRMNYSSGIIHARYVGPKKVITYDFEIYFNDKMYSEFSVNKHNNKKITYIKKLLEENHCKKNGKIKT